MNRPNLFSSASLPVPILISRPPLRRDFPVVLLVLGLFALSPAVRAVDPPPDGGYPGENTAEGDYALFSLTTGSFNTALGASALFGNTTGFANTAMGCEALAFNTTGSNNTAAGSNALEYNRTGTANTASGRQALFANKTGNNNTATGFQALGANTSGGDNTASGANALLLNSTGVNNTANGSNALLNNAMGSGNTAVGFGALMNKKTGSNNIALGVQAGFNLTAANNNIDIGNQGVAGDGGVVRIGTAGTHNTTFIAGISGVTVASGAAVVVNSNGKLGTIVSSARYKEAIKPMDQASEAILALQPVTFRYKKELDPERIPQFGLVAEQVEKVNPDLVVRGEDGKVMTVRYEAVNAMLLNEFLKEHRKVEEQQATITRLESKIAKQELTATQQQKQIETLTATVQKVSDQISPSKPSPQFVANP